MLAAVEKSPEPDKSSKRTKLRWDVLLADLSLFLSLTLARLIVWRALRTRRKERAARLKNMRVINGGQVATEDKAPLSGGVGEQGMLSEVAQSGFFPRRC